MPARFGPAGRDRHSGSRRSAPVPRRPPPGHCRKHRRWWIRFRPRSRPATTTRPATPGRGLARPRAAAVGPDPSGGAWHHAARRGYSAGQWPPYTCPSGRPISCRRLALAPGSAGSTKRGAPLGRSSGWGRPVTRGPALSGRAGMLQAGTDCSCTVSPTSAPGRTGGWPGRRRFASGCRGRSDPAPSGRSAA